MSTTTSEQKEAAKSVDSNAWVPPDHIESLFAATAGNQFASINKPVAGPRYEAELPMGEAPLQYYSVATPNGQRGGIMLEELGVDYDAHRIKIWGDLPEQFSTGFLRINPNSKIPAMVDREGGVNGEPLRLFESASILVYLADKYKRFMPEHPAIRAEVMNWVIWSVAGQGPTSGNFGHFFVYAPADAVDARNYGAARYGMEAQRLLDTLEKHLAEKGGRTYLVNEEYTIADIAVLPWVLQLRTGYLHASSGTNANKFLGVEDKYPLLMKWADRIKERPAVQRGLKVCPFSGDNMKPWREEKQGGK